MKSADYYIELDINLNNTQICLPMKVGDTKRAIHITLREGIKVYPIEKDCFAVFSGKKADGTVIENNCTISGNTIKYEITPQVTAVSGVIECELKLYGLNNGLLAAPRLAIVVDERAVSDDEIISSNEFSALTKLYSDINALKAEVEQKLANGDFKGDKGDKGEKGDKGDTVLTDEHYSPASLNAQSGVAVAEAVKDKLDDADGSVRKSNLDTDLQTAIDDIGAIKVDRLNADTAEDGLYVTSEIYYSSDENSVYAELGVFLVLVSSSVLTVPGQKKRVTIISRINGIFEFSNGTMYPYFNSTISETTKSSLNAPTTEAVYNAIQDALYVNTEEVIE